MPSTASTPLQGASRTAPSAAPQAPTQPSSAGTRRQPPPQQPLSTTSAMSPPTTRSHHRHHPSRMWTYHVHQAPPSAFSQTATPATACASKSSSYSPYRQICFKVKQYLFLIILLVGLISPRTSVIPPAGHHLSALQEGNDNHGTGMKNVGLYSLAALVLTASVLLLGISGTAAFVLVAYLRS